MCFQVGLSLIERDDGRWETAFVEVKEHLGHIVSEANFYSHTRVKKLSEEEVELVKQLDEASAKPASIAEVLNKKRGLGATFDGQFVRNMRSKLAKTKDFKTVREALLEVEESGGKVRIEKKAGTDDVDVLILQTSDQRKHLTKCKPKVFQSDTTFGTQAEKFKLYIMTYLSPFTGMWEVAQLIFLSCETKANVTKGLDFFKNSLPFAISPTERFIFFTDKDFDYIEVILVLVLSFIVLHGLLFCVFLIFIFILDLILL